MGGKLSLWLAGAGSDIFWAALRCGGGAESLNCRRFGCLSPPWFCLRSRFGHCRWWASLGDCLVPTCHQKALPPLGRGRSIGRSLLPGRGVGGDVRVGMRGLACVGWGLWEAFRGLGEMPSVGFGDAIFKRVRWSRCLR
jgi:hypothetical protein